jgi:hypothetical protein
MKLALLLALSLGTLGQAVTDPVVTLPDSYKLQFENDWVKVTRVTYAPYAKLPAHAHTTWAAAYVYLSDAGPVIFSHTDKDYHAITRPAVKAKSFRMNRMMQEEHEVENTSGQTSEFLRVEFKTEPRDAQTMRGRFYSEPDPSGTRIERLQFDNAQVRATRITLLPSQRVHISASATEPALLVAVTPAAAVALELGQERFLDVNQSTDFVNRGHDAIELLRFDLKTSPIEMTRVVH